MSSSVSNRVNLTAMRRRKGLTLIEAAMVLTILALVVAGVMLFYQNATTSQKVSQAAGQIAQIQQVIRTAYAGQSSYDGLAAANISGGLPRGMIDASGNIRNAFNGAVAVAAIDSGGTKNAFSVSFAGLPSDACIRLASVDMGRSVISLQAGTGTESTSPPYTPADAQAACKGNANTVIWKFY